MPGEAQALGAVAEVRLDDRLVAVEHLDALHAPGAGTGLDLPRGRILLGRFGVPVRAQQQVARLSTRVVGSVAGGVGARGMRGQARNATSSADAKAPSASRSRRARAKDSPRSTRASAPPADQPEVDARRRRTSRPKATAASS